LSSARRTASPPTGYSFGPRSPDRLLAAGLGSRRLTLHRPFPSAIAEGRRLALPPDGRRRPRSGASHRSDGTVLDTRRPPHRTSGIPIGAGEGPGVTPPPVPSLQYCDWRLRDSDPGMRLRLWAPFFVFSDDFFLLLPFFCLPGELRALALLGAPLLPLPSGAPLLPRHPGATGGRHFPPSLLGRGMTVPTHHPPGEAPVGPGEVQEHHPPHPGGHDAAVPRRLSSVLPTPLPAPPGLSP
jgi:hypothetical protein